MNSVDNTELKSDIFDAIHCTLKPQEHWFNEKCIIKKYALLSARGTGALAFTYTLHKNYISDPCTKTHPSMKYCINFQDKVDFGVSQILELWFYSSNSLMIFLKL